MYRSKISILFFFLTISLWTSLSGEDSKTIVPNTDQMNEFDVRWTLARIYSHRQETEELALKQYLWLLHEKPEDVDIVTDTAYLLMKMKRGQEALVYLYSALNNNPCNLKLLVGTAQGEALAGHPELSQDLYLKALNLSEADVKTTISFADQMMGWGDFYRAETIYREALEKEPDSLDLYLKIAWALVSQEQYEKAETIYRKLLSIYPEDPKILEALTRLQIQEKNFNDAYCTLLDLLETDPKNINFLKLKADILFLKNDYLGAISLYSTFQNNDKYTPIAYVNIGRAYRKLGKFEDAASAFEKALEIDPNNIEAKYYLEGDIVLCPEYIENVIASYQNIENLNRFADLYIQNGMAKNALLLFEAMLEIDPDYFPAQIGKAEMLSALFCYRNAIEIYQNLLDVFPQDMKLMVAIARVLGWSKQYDKSIQYYNSIISINPNNTTLYKEKARTAIWGKHFCLAMKTYDQLIFLSSCGPLSDFEELSGDYLSNSLIQKTACLEKRAKRLVWNKRYLHSLAAYDELLDITPGNEEALFDKAQSYCNLNLCNQSRCVYEKILELDPLHSVAEIALERDIQRNNFGIFGNLSYWRELGSGSFSQSQIARYKANTVFEYPISCNCHLRFIQQEYVENPFYNYKFYAAEGQTIEADCLFNRYVSGFFSASYKNYFKQFRSTFSGINRLIFNMNDACSLVLECNKEDVIYNYFSLKQAIQSTNSIITLSSNINHQWNLAGTYQHYHYNDHNDQDYVNLTSEYQFLDEPHIIKLILKGNYRNTAHQTVSISIGNKLIDVIHPYWTPDKYFSGSATLQYRYDYRKFLFCGAPDRYIDIKITGETDNVNNPSIQAAIEWKHEFDAHFGFEIKGLIHRSKLWNAEGFWGTLNYRF